MDPALAPGSPSRAIVFQDGLGERRRISDVSGADTIEQLCLRSELTAIPSFEFALRERASRLVNFRHVYFGRVRSVDRLNDAASTLAVVSDSIKGVRLANLLAASERRPMTLDITASVHLMRQLVAAVAMLHENARDVAHGAIAPERVIVTPNARVVLVEYVLGAALEQLHYSAERYWKDLRVPLPPSHGLPRFDHRVDVTQVGVVALSLVLGRLLNEQEYPARVPEVLASAFAISSKGEFEPLPHGLRSWIGRALQLDPRQSFADAIEARDELERVLAGEGNGGHDDVPHEQPVAAVQMPSEAAVQMHPQRDSSPVKADPVFGKLDEAVAKSEPVPSRVMDGFDSAGDPDPWKLETRVRSEPSIRPAPQPGPEVSFAHVDAFAPLQPSNPVRVAPQQGRETVLPKPKRPRMVAAVAAAVVVLAAGGYAARKYAVQPSPVVTTGTLSISSNPPGAQVGIDGQPRGVTPLMLTLNAGNHNVELRGAGEPRTLPVTITAGTQVSQYIELPKITAFGQLQVRSEPAGAQVTVDGIARGKAPVLVESLAAGEHTVVMDAEGANIKQVVSIEPGSTASLVIPLIGAENAPLSGWISVSAPVELQVFENRRLIGTSQSERLMVSAGRHEIELVNETVGYRQVRTIQVAAGRVAPLKVEWPKGTIAINALPWAEVLIDGEKVGETPIGNLSLPIGPHEILFRHPELGEQRFATTVTLKAQARVSVDLRKK
jgi:serine/threonine protein kinase